MPNSAAAPSSGRVHPRRARRETASSATDAPTTRSQATVRGATSSKSRTAIVAPTYWATAERTKSASGEAVSRKRVVRDGLTPAVGVS